MKMMRKSHKESDVDEESLVLFRELHRRPYTSLLLQPVSNEFDSDIGNNAAAFRIGSASVKKSLGHEFLGDTSKNDYDWLKTPPATPLFPSLEMEATGSARELIVQRELPILQPLSRFAEPLKESDGPNKDYCLWKGPNSTTKPTPMYQKPSTNPIRSEPKPKPTTVTPPANQIPTRSSPALARSQPGKVDADKPKPKIYRGQSPSPRVRRPATNKLGQTLASAGQTLASAGPGIGLFSDPYEAPPNLKKSDPRPKSNTRGRPSNNSVSKSSVEAQLSARRQSCSPSNTARGRKQGLVAVAPALAGVSQKGKIREGGGNVVGSSMVDKMLRARRTAASDLKKPNGNLGTTSSALKNMETRTDRFSSHNPGTVAARSSSRPRSSCK